MALDAGGGIDARRGEGAGASRQTGASAAEAAARRDETAARVEAAGRGEAARDALRSPEGQGVLAQAAGSVEGDAAAAVGGAQPLRHDAGLSSGPSGEDGTIQVRQTIGASSAAEAAPTPLGPEGPLSGARVGAFGADPDAWIGGGGTDLILDERDAASFATSSAATAYARSLEGSHAVVAEEGRFSIYGVEDGKRFWNDGLTLEAIADPERGPSAADVTRGEGDAVVEAIVTRDAYAVRFEEGRGVLDRAHGADPLAGHREAFGPGLSGAERSGARSRIGSSSPCATPPSPRSIAPRPRRWSASGSRARASAPRTGR